MLTFLSLTLLLFPGTATALAATPTSTPGTKGYFRSYLVTGANKGQGYALCSRILAEHPDTHVFLCSRDYERGINAKGSLVADLIATGDSIDDGNVESTEDSGSEESIMERIDVIQLDVTDDTSVQNAKEKVKSILDGSGKSAKQKRLFGVVSNAGILWGYPLPQLMDVCATGVKQVLDAFVPLINPDPESSDGDGRVVVVTSGLGPLMHGYAAKHHQHAMMSDDCTWEKTLAPMMEECIKTYQENENIPQRIEAFDKIGFPGGPFADSAPDFHMYGIAKMLGDAYMKVVAKNYPNLRVNSVDPGLVYTDLILRMPKYEGKEIGESGAQSPKEGVEATMRLLFDKNAGKGKDSGKLFAMSKDKTKLVCSDIDKMPQKQDQ